MCLSLTVGELEARVRHASIRGETVQLPQIAMFKPCQLLIHLPSKLCIRWAELDVHSMCAMIFSLLTPYRVFQTVWITEKLRDLGQPSSLLC